MKKILLLLLVIGMYAVSCKKDDNNDTVPVEEKSSYDKMMAYLGEKGGYDTYIQAMKMMEMDKIMGDVPLTPIVPTDKAFKECMEELGYSSLDDFPKEDLKNLLKLHIATTCSKELENTNEYLPTMMMPKIGKNPINVFGRRPSNELKNLENAMFMDSRVIEEPEYIGSYFMHPVDRVMKPPTLMDFIRLDPMFSLMYDKIMKESIGDKYYEFLTKDEAKTVMMPYDFISEIVTKWNGYDDFEDLPDAIVKWIIENNMLPDQLIYVENLKTPLNAMTMSGIVVTFTYDDLLKCSFPGNNYFFMSNKPTIQANNGNMLILNMAAQI